MKNRSRQRAARRDRNSRPRPDGLGKSKYARKYAWLHAHGMWGFDVPQPKPWKSA